MSADSDIFLIEILPIRKRKGCQSIFDAEIPVHIQKNSLIRLP